jgi:spore maturation protein SpmB
MRELQTLNTAPDTATNAQILFLVINTSSVTIFPVTIFTYRAQLGAADPTDVFIPILIATYVSTLVGLIATATVQRINLINRAVLGYLGAITLLVLGLVSYFASLDPLEMQRQSAIMSNFLLFALIVLFIAGAVRKRENVYEAFIEGARDGFQIAVGIIPYLVAMLVAIGVFRASGGFDLLTGAIRSMAESFGWDTRFVDGIPTALMKPLSGSGARAMMVDTMHIHGADSFAGRLVSVIQGSTETTFYVLALYFGAVGIRKARHAIACGLLADLGGVLAAIAVTYFFFG